MHIPDFAVNGAGTPRLFNVSQIIRRCRKAVDIERRDPLHGQHDGLRTQETLYLMMIHSASRAHTGIKQRDVDFVRALRAVPIRFHTDKTTEAVHGINQILHFTFR